MPKVLFTGASGYIGGEILAQLGDTLNADLSSKLDIFAVYRKDAHVAPLEKLGCKPVKLDLSDHAAVQQFIRENKIEIMLELTEPFRPDLATASIEAMGTGGSLISTGGAKLFSSFAGYDTRSTLYDDADPLTSPLIRDGPPEWLPAVLGRRSYAKILDTAKQHNANAYIVIPCIVYGQSRAFGNPLSIQVVGLVKAIQHYGHPIVIPGTDGQPQTYAVCHIADCAALYIALLRASVGGPKASSGIYFAENGAIDWKVLATEFAKGLALDGDVQEADAKMQNELVGVLGLRDESWVRPSIGGRNNISGRGARKIGWEPQYDADHLRAVASEEARFIARSLEH